MGISQICSLLSAVLAVAKIIGFLPHVSWWVVVGIFFAPLLLSLFLMVLFGFIAYVMGLFSSRKQ